jgi:hypothetical protein
MRKLLTILFLTFTVVLSSTSQNKVTKTRFYNFPPTDAVLSGLISVRAAAYGDIDGDGKPEFAFTNYYDQGHVHVFNLAAKDTFVLVWSSPKVDSQGGFSSPRNVRIGDLDNDGKKEIIFESANNGIFIYEWDGVVGSHNFGTKLSQLINSTNCTGYPKNVSGTPYTEYFEVTDVDGDSKQELILAFRGAQTTENKYMIIRAIGDWSTGDPGFSALSMIYVAARPDLAKWGLSDGSANSMITGNLDGQGAKEIILQNWNRKNVTILRSTGTDKWSLADTLNEKQNVYLLGPVDGVGYFGGFSYDVNKDGRDEIYIPTSISDASDLSGQVHMISYSSGQSVNEIDSAANVTVLDFGKFTQNGLYGFGYGDIDDNGKPNLYFTSPKIGASIVTAEFQGGSIKDTASWKLSVLYGGDTTAFSLTIKDSLGKVDTISGVYEYYFPAKIFAQKTDIDNDGKEDIIVPYQPWKYKEKTDSIRITKLTWNNIVSKFDTTSFKVLNPKRHSFVVLEKSSTTGIEARDITFITPDDYKLEQNYPNPFNPSTKIAFTLPVNNKISLKVYDILGKEVRMLINGEDYVKGSHSVTWDGKNNFGASVASGTYIYKLSFNTFEKSMKMMLLK